MYVVIELNEDEVRELQKEVSGAGGFQSLLRMMCAKLHGNQLRLEPEAIRKMRRYVADYGQGGFQDRLASILEALKGLYPELAEDAGPLE